MTLSLNTACSVEKSGGGLAWVPCQLSSPSLSCGLLVMVSCLKFGGERMRGCKVFSLYLAVDVCILFNSIKTSLACDCWQSENFLAIIRYGELWSATQSFICYWLRICTVNPIQWENLKLKEWRMEKSRNKRKETVDTKNCDERCGNRSEKNV